MQIQTAGASGCVYMCAPASSHTQGSESQGKTCSQSKFFLIGYTFFFIDARCPHAKLLFSGRANFKLPPCFIHLLFVSPFPLWLKRLDAVF